MQSSAFQDRQEHPKVRTMVLTVMLVAGIPLLLIGLLVIQQFGDAYRTKITDHLTLLMRKHSRTVDGFLADRVGDIRVLARSHSIEQLTDQDFLTRKLAILREEYGGFFVDLGLIDPQGIQQVYSGPFHLAKADYAGAPWFSEIKRRQYAISDVFSGLRDSPHFIVAATIPRGDEGWILRATVDFNAFNALVSNIRIGSTGLAYILNRSGEPQTRSPFERGPLGGPKQAFLDTNLAADTVLIEEHPDAVGKDSIFAVTPLNNGRWILIYQQEMADAFALWNTTKALAIVLFGFWAAIVGLFTYFVSKHMTLRFEEVIVQKDKMSDQVVEAGRLASIGELAAGIAHEINNPVAIMVEEAGWIQDLLAEDDPTTAENLAEIDRATNQIKTQGGRCKEITHKLLSFARKTDPTAKKLDLNQLIEEMITLIDQKTRYANVKIDTQLDSDLPLFLASATELQQVLLNLLNNSVDAMDSTGGHIQITTRLVDNHIVLDLTDNGIGIADANLARIFDPFYTTKPVGQGTGLGLSICYGIIQKLGGKIHVQSAKGKGSTFTIFLPVKTGSGGGPEDLDHRSGTETADLVNTPR